jgi:hypothetical protein
VQEAQETGDHFERFVYPLTRARVHASLKQSRRRRWWTWSGVLAAPVAAAVVMLARSEGPDADYTGTKGGGLLVTFVKDGDKARLLHEGDSVPLNALLRFEARVPQGCWWTVLSVDETGTVSQLYPEQGSVFIERPELLRLGAELDDRPGPERLFAFCAESDVPADQLRRSVRSSVAPSSESVRTTRMVKGLPAGVRQDTILVEKTR